MVCVFLRGFRPVFARPTNRWNTRPYYYILDLESHGALYRLHSHLNHSCSPNVSVQHPLIDTQPAKVTIVAKRPIASGEELTVTYVNPRNSLKKRRRELKEWGFGECQCERCLEEEKTREGKEEGNEDDLEDELRGFLGV